MAQLVRPFSLTSVSNNCSLVPAATIKERDHFAAKSFIATL
jgi:hypothetical protein